MGNNRYILIDLDHGNALMSVKDAVANLIPFDQDNR